MPSCGRRPGSLQASPDLQTRSGHIRDDGDVSWLCRAVIDERAESEVERRVKERVRV